MSPETELRSWLRDAHPMEMQAIQILENQARRIESYPELRNRILEHLEETRTMMGHPSLPDYAATKAAIHSFTRSLAFLLTDRGIRVNCVAPGPVWTPLIAATRSPETVAGHGAGGNWKRPAQPAEMAPSYVFLTSTDSRYYTGEVFAPSGMQTTSR